MEILLSAETRKLVEDRMKRDGYASPDEVVRAALASLDQNSAGGDFASGEMDALLSEGDRGGASLDGEEVLAELAGLRARHPGHTG